MAFITSGGGNSSLEVLQDLIGPTFTDTTSIDFTYNDGPNTISAAVLPAGVDHNSLANLATGDVHTQYAKKAGDTFSGSILFSAGAIGADGANRPSAVYIGGKVAVADGSATSPTHTFDDDENTGLFRVTSDIIGFATGGTHQWSMNAAGDLITNTDNGPMIGLSGSGRPSILRVGTRIQLGPNADATAPSIELQNGINRVRITSPNSASNGEMFFTVGGVDVFDLNPSVVFCNIDFKMNGALGAADITWVTDGNGDIGSGAADPDNIYAKTKISSRGTLEVTSNASIAATTDVIKIGGYDLGAGVNRTLALGTEQAVGGAPAAANASLIIRINGVSYQMHLTSV